MSKESILNPKIQIKIQLHFLECIVQYCELIPFRRYTLLIGRPPSETNILEEIYSRTKKCE